MLRNDIYYGLKPLIPKAIRMGLRRSIAARKRRRVSDVWPILPGSERPPLGWPGWPEGKKFAFVLTHDVEGPSGLAKCRELMQVEKKLGFRSSFNFVPEGDYRVSREIREELVQNGFEVGVHDFHHDGRLYRTRGEFAEKARRINRYLQEWSASGFRSGFMLHKLEWLHDLDIQYDASTFDTDPFEPQPDGVGTIFPFWVPAPAATEDRGRKTEDRGGGNGERSDFSLSASQRFSASKTGYVELPYTLPQDSTLFLLFREPTIDIWRSKLDWIVQHGGMALVNVHPDYVGFNGAVAKAGEFPFTHYKSFLEYVSRQYEGDFWNATPKEVAQFCLGALNVPTASAV